MPATLTSLAPNSATPGSMLTLTGSGFLAGAIALFNSDSQAGQAIAMVLSPTELRCFVPDLPAGDYDVRVVNEGESPTAVRAFTVLDAQTVDQTLCSLDELKELLNLPDTNKASDRQLRACLRMATADIKGFVGHGFHVDEYTELYDGDDSALLTLRQAPVVSLVALAIDGLAVDPAEAKVYQNRLKFDGGADYNARLRSSGRIFPCGSRNISVTYRAGYAAVPEDIKLACARQAVYAFNTLAKQGVTTENNEQSKASKTFSLDGQLAPAVKAACLRYRRTPMVAVI